MSTTKVTTRRGLRSFFILLFGAGLALLGLAALDVAPGGGWTAFLLTYGLVSAGALGWITMNYRGTIPGIRNDDAVRRRGWAHWLLALVLAAFYTAYYWWPDHLSGVTRMADPLSRLLRGVPADHWFLYGYFYTLAVLLMGVRMLFRYRHSRYQRLRTWSVMGFQLLVAFLLPSLLRMFNQPEFYFSYFWPLQPKYLYPAEVKNLIAHPGGLGTFMVVWGIAALVVATPILTWSFGKRWYCSWCCGCGGLAETAGDPYRHLSSKSLAAWKFERWSIHLVLVIITLGTILLWVNDTLGGSLPGQASFQFKRAYGFIVVTMLAGLVGVAAYPLLGSRVWCRFFCPMAAILGLQQRYFSRFRITTNGGQCMSCGNCSTYCEMGIDVRSYAQRGANIVRASCVGCGICSAVCPRGVLNLENGRTHGDRYPGADRPLAEFFRSLRS